MRLSDFLDLYPRANVRALVNLGRDPQTALKAIQGTREVFVIPSGIVVRSRDGQQGEVCLFEKGS